MKKKISKIYRYLWLLFLLAGFPVLAQQKSFTGTIHDKSGNAVTNALVIVREQPLTRTFTDAEGKFTIVADPGSTIDVSTTDNRYKSVVLSGEQIDVVVDREEDMIPVGFGMNRVRESMTSSVGFIKSDELLKSSVYNPTEALYGKIPGLSVLQNGGTGWNTTPDVFIRGVETFGIGDFVNTNILVLVDGFERRLSSLSMSEIENVTVLKDAAALAIYGLRGANGVLLVTTKRGVGKGLSVDASYEHGITSALRIPEFLDASGYASAMNQALVNDGSAARYYDTEITKFGNGSSPYLYPNVNWIDEGMRDFGASNVFNLSFQEIATAVRYFGVLNFYSEQGLLGPVDLNDGYSTQISNYKINLRTNVEVDLTRTTKLTARIAGNIGVWNRPSTSTSESSLITALYSTPAAAFPVKTYNNVWGGTTTFPNNPMAMITDIGHTERGQNELMIDLLVNQGLNKFIKGLSVDLGISLDNAYHFQDVWSRQYQYNQVSPVVDATGAVVDTTDALYGTNTSMAFSTSVPYQWRRFTGLLDFKHTISWGNNQLNSVLLFQGDQLIILGRYNTYRHLLAAGNFNYSKAGKYFVDLGWSVNGTNILPESSRVGFFPALSLGWKLSEENFLKDVSAINFMKLRASFGMTGNDQVIQNISTSPYVSGNGYRFTSSNSSAGGLREGRLASDPLTYETSYKSNIGVDATLFNLLDVNIDAFYNKRTGILVETRGSISGVIGVPLPYSSSGIVSNSGVELALNLHDDAGSFTYHIGGSLSYAKNKIIEMLEEYRPEEYLKRTGQSINQAFGLIDNGFFRDAGDISSSDVQTFSIVKPGDIKYVDQNEDNIINKYDEKPIGYSTQNPEFYYAGSFGAQYKGFGVEALLQGISHMTVYLNTPSVFWPLRSNNNISTYSNDSWTPATAATATLPRLTTLENANNFRPNTIWYADGSYLKLRSIELYYKLPLSIISKVKLSSATIYFRGMNLLSFDKIDVVDPEAIGLDYPTLKTYNVGIKIGF